VVEPPRRSRRMRISRSLPSLPSAVAGAAEGVQRAATVRMSKDPVVRARAATIERCVTCLWGLWGLWGLCVCGIGEEFVFI
jgi:hypothetical protein